MGKINAHPSLSKKIFSGNEVDQVFSILASEFKKAEMITVDDLKQIIVDSPIVPKPICRTLWYIFGWHNYIQDQLADPQLQNHSRYNSFLISLEEGQAKLRGKKLPQHTLLVPRAGIRLLREGHGNGPVNPADFRVDKIKWDEIYKGLNIFWSKLNLEKKMSSQAIWDRLREKLEALPRKSGNLEKMVLTDFPEQTTDVPTVPNLLRVVEETPPLTGDLYPEEICDGHIEDEAAVDMDVCIYTQEKAGRPWVGRILEVLENKRFKLQWFVRKTCRSKVFTALTNSDGSPCIAELEFGMVMFWMMSEPQSRTANSFALSPYWLETIDREYAVIDD